ncbi:MAG: hypothetical protein P8J86_07855 [Phycisphaerales bacterium]|nr:hypothetical protein [Phycisphaerales bacterium]
MSVVFVSHAMGDDASSYVGQPGTTDLEVKLLSGFGGVTNAPETSKHGDGFQQLTRQWEYITDWQLLASIIIGLVVAALCAAMIAWQPGTGAASRDPSYLEERKALIALGVLGAMVANIVEVSPPMALVIFGIGGLIRFRTVFERPKVTARAIGVVVIGLACGLNLIAMAIILALFFWILLLLLEAKSTVEVKLQVDPSRDIQEVIERAQSCLNDAGLQVYRTTANRSGTQVTVTVQLDSSVTASELAKTIQQSIPPGPPVVIHWSMK